ncbi:CRISPR-associated endoribonuclease Cas6 [Acetoanaerobium noterae]|uniref:CRISPR-associated endoribonuclease Cas6 n=1 Tax=Acetoanaerobium noterae TaxID=745369 RepID=UPI0028A70B28|nr:CRISPR-associated endoribonuclease Cas6 [Acetoanaerobium noterae]
MRFLVELSLDGNYINKDKNRVIISILKNCFESYSKDYFEELYKNPHSKDFTFSLFLGMDAKFEREVIEVPSKKIFLNFSTYEAYDGMMFYNSILNKVGQSFKYKDDEIKIEKIILKKEKPIFSDKVKFRTLSPVISRDHHSDNKSTWYYSLSEEKGQEVFIRNFKRQIIEKFGDSSKYDLKEVKFKFNTKNVKIKNYSIEILGNVGDIYIEAKPYILDYIYKGGLGGKRNSGFGLLEIL